MREDAVTGDRTASWAERHPKIVALTLGPALGVTVGILFLALVTFLAFLIGYGAHAGWTAGA